MNNIIHRRRFGGHRVVVLLFMIDGVPGTQCVLTGSLRADRGIWHAVTK